MSFLTYDTADDIISGLEIIEKLLFPETDFLHDNYLNLIFTGFYIIFTMENTYYLLLISHKYFTRKNN